MHVSTFSCSMSNPFCFGDRKNEGRKCFFFVLDLANVKVKAKAKRKDEWNEPDSVSNFETWSWIMKKNKKKQENLYIFFKNFYTMKMQCICHSLCSFYVKERKETWKKFISSFSYANRNKIKISFWSSTKRTQ